MLSPDMRGLLESLELVEDVELLQEGKFALRVVHKDTCVEVDADYAPNGVLTLEHFAMPEELSSLPIAENIVQTFRAQRGRFLTAKAGIMPNGVYIRCRASINAPEYHLRKEWSDFLNEHINACLMRYCMELGELYRMAMGDPTIFWTEAEIGNA